MIGCLSRKYDCMHLHVISFGGQTTGTMDNWYHAIFDWGGKLITSSFARADGTSCLHWQTMAWFQLSYIPIIHTYHF